MAIKFQPTNMLRRIAPKKKVERLVTQKLTLNRAAVTFLERSDVLSKKKLEKIALKVIKQYKSRYKDERADGLSKSAALDETLNKKKLMVQRVRNACVYEIAQDIKSEYRGEYYVWLPSTASEPDPQHQLNYGLTFQLGVGEMPGDRYGCMCGMQILVDETRLNL